MFAAWRLSHFLLQALKTPAQDCAAVLDGSPCNDSARREDALLLCISKKAEEYGVRGGMSASQALARCPHLTCLHRDEAAERLLQEQLLKHAETWTANYESTQPGVCVLDLRRIYRLHQQCWFEQGRLMHQDLKENGYEICVGIAEKADLALLASHVAEPVKVIQESAAEEKAAFLELPLSVLSPAPRLLQTLNLWGIHTLGELKKLKRQAVGERLGAEGMQLWDLAQGGKDRLLKLVRPDIHYRQEAEFENGIETLDLLLHLLREFCQQLCLQLGLEWKVAAQMHLELRFEDGTVHQKGLRIAEPGRDCAVLLRILETHLESVKASAPIGRVSLEITPSDPSAAQDLLFDRGLRNPAQFAETLSALEALLGSDRVGRGMLLPTHQPDAFRITSFLEKPVTPVQPAGAHFGLPLQRFRPPRQAEVVVREARPCWLRSGSRSVELIGCEGPWFLSGHWWDARHAWKQEIWDVADQDGNLYRLVNENGGWKLEGCYG